MIAELSSDNIAFSCDLSREVVQRFEVDVVLMWKMEQRARNKPRGGLTTQTTHNVKNNYDK